MNVEPSEDTLTTLLQIVERDRDERCLRIRQEAEREARRIVQEARAEARRRVGDAIAEARRRAQARVDQARAALVTETRSRRQEASRALLERAWETLPEALAARWRATDRRREWLDAVVALAATSLPLGTWEVSHPGDLPEDDAARIVERVTEATGERPVLEPTGDIGAGLRICVGASCLDGTVRGLLADRTAVEGRLIAELIHEVERKGGER